MLGHSWQMWVLVFYLLSVHEAVTVLVPVLAELFLLILYPLRLRGPILPSVHVPCKHTQAIELTSFTRDSLRRGESSGFHTKSAACSWNFYSCGRSYLFEFLNYPAQNENLSQVTIFFIIITVKDIVYVKVLIFQFL